MAMNNCTSEKKMHTLVNRDMGMSRLKMQTPHQLSDSRKQKWLFRAKVLLNMFKDGTGLEEIIFSD